VAAMAVGRTVGSAPCANLYGLKVFDSNGATFSNRIESALEVVTYRHLQKGFNAKTVVNLSLGGPCAKSCQKDGLVLKLTALSKLGMVFSVAAGNEGVDASLSSPAACPEAVTVAASNITDDFSGYSNHGSFIDITAPGTFVTSACSSTTLEYNGKCAGGRAYVYTSGTSLAAPLVTGVLAQYIEKASLPNQDGTALPMTSLAAVNLIRDTMVCEALVDQLGKVPANTVNNLVQLPTNDGYIGCGDSRIQLIAAPTPGPTFAPSGPSFAPTEFNPNLISYSSESSSIPRVTITIVVVVLIFLFSAVVSILCYCKRLSQIQQYRNTPSTQSNDIPVVYATAPPAPPTGYAPTSSYGFSQPTVLVVPAAVYGHL
jgi:hypothetical protein